jgi:hypothetical protein
MPVTTACQSTKQRLVVEEQISEAKCVDVTDTVCQQTLLKIFASDGLQGFDEWYHGLSPDKRVRAKNLICKTHQLACASNLVGLSMAVSKPVPLNPRSCGD